MMRLWLLCMAAVMVAGCKNGRGIQTPDSTAYLAESVVAILNAAITDDVRATNLAHADLHAHRALANLSACSTSRYSPALGSQTCLNTVKGETVTSTLDCLVNQNQDALLKGTVTLTFDTPTTCATWLTGTAQSGTVTWTSTNFDRVLADATAVTTSSAPSDNYNNVSIGGGIETAFSSSSFAISVLGVRTVRVLGDTTIYDHSVHTSSAINASISPSSATPVISSGTITVDHNLANYSAFGTLSALSWNSNCCVPDAGQMSFTLSGSRTGTVVVNFNTGTCGTVNVTDSSVAVTTSGASPSPTGSPVPVVYTQSIGGCQ
jgi:hypothetical protein